MRESLFIRLLRRFREHRDAIRKLKLELAQQKRSTEFEKEQRAILQRRFDQVVSVNFTPIPERDEIVRVCVNISLENANTKDPAFFSVIERMFQRELIGYLQTHHGRHF